jgi:hypothetical protein
MCGEIAEVCGGSRPHPALRATLPIKGRDEDGASGSARWRGAKFFFLVPPPRGEGGHIESGANDVQGGGCFDVFDVTPPGLLRHPSRKEAVKKGREKKG